MGRDVSRVEEGRRSRKGRIVAALIAAVGATWQGFKLVVEFVNLPSDTNDAWEAIVTAFSAYPLILLALAVAALIWSFWPSKQLEFVAGLPPPPPPPPPDPELDAIRRETERTRLLDEQRQAAKSAEFHAALGRYADMSWSVQDEIDLQGRKSVERRRGYSDEWNWQAAKDKDAAKIERDKALGEALAFHVEGRWGCEFFETVKSELDPGGAPLEHAIQLAYDGALTIWGKRSEGGVHEKIPDGFWADHHVDIFSLMRGKPKTVPNSGTVNGALYFDLMVSRAECEKVMPCDVAAIRTQHENRGNEGAPSTAGGPFVERMILQNRREKANKRRAAYDEALKYVEEADRRRALIALGRDLAHRFRAKKPREHWENWVRRQRAYMDIQPHLGDEYQGWIIRNARTVHLTNDGSSLPEAMFLRELARLEKEWGLI